MRTIHAIHPAAAAAVGSQAPKTIPYGRPFIWCYLHRSSSLSFSSLSSCACVRNVRARQRVPLIMWGFSVCCVLSRRFNVCAYSYYMVHKHAYVKIDLIHMHVYICLHISIYICTCIYRYLTCTLANSLKSPAQSPTTTLLNNAMHSDDLSTNTYSKNTYRGARYIRQ